jgi:DNA-binding NarL/FixJ family response regulator
MYESTSVVIVDDHPLFRQGLRQLLEEEPSFRFAGEAWDGIEALSLIQRTKPQVAVLDINLPGLSGLEIARELQKGSSRTALVILTMSKDEETVNRALDFGVKGYVLKENAVQDILDSIRSAARGEPYLSHSISNYLLRRRSRAMELADTKPGIDSLTKAERRILKLISEKKTSKQIAAELFISPRTVDTHRSNICSKLALRGNNSLLQFALENRSAL